MSHFNEESAGVQGEGVGYAGLGEYFSAYLQARGVPTDVASERGYREVFSGKPLDGTFAASYGFPRKSAGLLIPLHGVLNDAWQLRLDPAVQDTFTNAKGKAIRFLTPRGQKNVLATSPRTRHLLTESEQVVVVAEGVTRIDALAAYDVPAIGMTGIWNWLSAGTALPDWESLRVKGQRFIIAPDGDARINEKVASAVRRLRRWLLGKGADTVHVLMLPDDLGLDDWIAQSHFADQGALTRAMRAMVSENPALAPAPDPPPRQPASSNDALDDTPRIGELGLAKRTLVENGPRIVLAHMGRGRHDLYAVAPDGLLLRQRLGRRLEFGTMAERALGSWLYELATDGAASRAARALARSCQRESGLDSALAMVDQAVANWGPPPDAEVVEAGQVDRQLSFIGCLDGVLDIRAAKLLAPAEARAKLVTGRANARWRPDVPADKSITDAVDQIMPRREDCTSEAQVALLRSFAWGMVHLPQREIIGHISAPGSGKTTFRNAVSHTFGELVAETRPDTLSHTNGGGAAHNSGLFKLGPPVRILFVPDARGGFDTTLLNRIAGGESSITARTLREAEETFPITAMVVIQGNHPPQGKPYFGLTGDDDDSQVQALIDRLRLIDTPAVPRTRVMPKLLTIGQDPAFRDALFSRTVEWMRDALDMASLPTTESSPTLRDALAKLRARESPSWRVEFIPIALVRDPSRQVTSQAVLKAVTEWINDNDRGTLIPSQTQITRSVNEAYGIKAGKLSAAPDRGKNGWRGWRLVIEDDTPYQQDLA